MKLNPLVSSLSLYDVSLYGNISRTPVVAADVSHINARYEVVGYQTEAELGKALEGSDVVIIPAGEPRLYAMTLDDLFDINASIVKSLCTAIAKYCPNALVNMISNPVNSIVPIAAEVFKTAGTYDEGGCLVSLRLMLLEQKLSMLERLKSQLQRSLYLL